MMRPRRDPRADLMRHTSRVGSRLRIDRLSVSGEPIVAAVTASKPAILTIDDPAFLVAVVPDGDNRILTAWDRQVLGAARVLAGVSGAVVLLGDRAGAASAGADRVVADPGLGVEDPGARAARIAALLEALRPRHTLFAESATGGDLARRVSAMSGRSLFPYTEFVTARSVVRACRAGTREVAAPPGDLVALALDVAAEYAGPEREARRVELPLDGETAGTFARIGPPTRDPAATPLDEAPFVVAAGNGISDFASFHRLVALLGATAGASRAVCDAGQMPRDRQVGASGTVLGGKCYLAVGIAGAPQHLQGIGRIEHVIAVNIDLHAAMIRRADLAIVADAQRVMPALIRLLEAQTP